MTILVGAEAAAYLKANPEVSMMQTIQETGRGVRITIDPKINFDKLELEVLIKLIDGKIAERTKVEGHHISDFTANLYSSRSHLVRAIREVSL